MTQSIMKKKRKKKGKNMVQQKRKGGREAGINIKRTNVFKDWEEGMECLLFLHGGGARGFSTSVGNGGKAAIAGSK